MARSLSVILATALAATSAHAGLRTLWTPPACEELEPGVACRKLYEHPQGSTFVGSCPVESMTNADGCAAQFKGKAD
eukprot:CAMPEP_0197909094 /NCGR_PEP_ID=MMETSP1439-20131203/68196_1 /TAXON_ID=66791 /ORGANISM="Gonyaulax spinifera, Strain CCMP409" /LENGTH=76 /DNA_ID=CAMNT_0043530643 /DNA_START=48 /DNA_END=275 /DNA_ORIENTATION=-